MDSITRPGKTALSAVAVLSGSLLLLGLSACSAPADGAASDATGGAAAVAPPVVMSEGELVICANFDSPPNIFLDEGGANAGVEFDIANAIAERMGLTPRFEAMAWGGMLPALQAKQCDTIMSTLYVSEEREEIVDFVPYIRTASGILVHSDNPKKITGYDESLCGNRLLTISGTDPDLVDAIQGLCAEEGLPQMEVSSASSTATALQQISSKQVDAYLESTALLAYYAKLSDGQFIVAGEPANPNLIAAATLKGNPELHEAIQAAFDEIVADGTYDEILAEWGQESLSVENA